VTQNVDVIKLILCWILHNVCDIFGIHDVSVVDSTPVFKWLAVTTVVSVRLFVILRLVATVV